MLKTSAGPGAGDLLVYIEGEVDLYRSPALAKELDTILEKNYQHILLVCTKLEYLDSSGVGVLIRVVQRSRQRKTMLAIAGLQGGPLKVLQLSNIASLFSIYPTVEAAMAFWSREN